VLQVSYLGFYPHPDQRVSGPLEDRKCEPVATLAGVYGGRKPTLISSLRNIFMIFAEIQVVADQREFLRENLLDNDTFQL
jgi:hypothetical protein